jgi:hypothetical protein
MTLDAMGVRASRRTSRKASWELSPDEPGVLVDFTRGGVPSGVRSSRSTHAVGTTPLYDEVDRRLMDTFPASDAVGRY